MEKLKAWLLEHNISVVRPKLAGGGLVTLQLHPPTGSDFEIDFYPDDLEQDPDDAIAFIQTYLARRLIRL